MKRPAVPYAVPKKIEPKLAGVLAYWQSLKRAENNMPFWDDVATSSLSELAERSMLIKVFAKPERFRLTSVGKQLVARYGEPVADKFIDEMELRNPFEYLRSQCSATVESRAPTYYQRASHTEKSRVTEAYSRLLLPLWGDGRIGMVLGAVDWP